MQLHSLLFAPSLVRGTTLVSRCQTPVESDLLNLRDSQVDRVLRLTATVTLLTADFPDRV